MKKNQTKIITEVFFHFSKKKKGFDHGITGRTFQLILSDKKGLLKY